MDGRLPESNVK